MLNFLSTKASLFFSCAVVMCVDHCNINKIFFVHTLYVRIAGEQTKVKRFCNSAPLYSVSISIVSVPLWAKLLYVAKLQIKCITQSRLESIELMRKT